MHSTLKWNAHYKHSRIIGLFDIYFNIFFHRLAYSSQFNFSPAIRALGIAPGFVWAIT
jgi:hypothetical protein